MNKTFRLIFSTIFILSAFFSGVPPVSAQTVFNFVAWGDTKGDSNVLTNLSNQVKLLNPVFTIYAGDLESAGFTITGMNTWKNAINGGTNNGMFDKTFPVRGNHDDAVVGTSATGWQNYFDLASHVQRIGGTNYSALNDDLTYSFDFGNSRIIGIDVPGNVTKMTAAQIFWLDERLTDAEIKGLKHAFFFWHGPFYYIANHVSGNPPPDLINVINKHPIVSAGFYGHEHSLAYTQINSSRTPGITQQFEQIVSGDAGAGPTTPTSGRYDYWLDLAPNFGGFALISVNGGSFTVDFYKGGTTSSLWSKTFSKSGSTPPPPVTPTRTPTQPMITLTRTPTPPSVTGTIIPSPSRTPTQPVVSPTQTIKSPTPIGNVCTYFKN